MAIYTRIISVSFLSQTNTKPHRYVIRAAGFPKSIVGTNKYETEEDAVREYVENIMPPCMSKNVARIDFIRAQRYANPNVDKNGNGDALFLTSYNEVYASEIQSEALQAQHSPCWTTKEERLAAYDAVIAARRK